MKKLVAEYELQGKEIKAYLVEMAEWIHKEFATTFATKMNAGRFFALAPEGIPRERLLDFKTGGLTRSGKEFSQQGYHIVEKRTLELDFATVLAQIITDHPRAAIAGFDALIKEEFPDNNSLDLSKKPFGILDRKKNNPSEITEFINDFASAWTTVVLVVDQPAKIKAVENLGNVLIGFAVAAYDGESFVYWLNKSL